MSIPNRYGDSSSGAQIPGQEPDVSSAALASYVITRVKNGRDARDTKWEKLWDEYTRLWRGFYKDGEDANTNSERSKLIAPALQQAVEMTVAEMEEAVFNREAWFDVSDDYADEEREDVAIMRDMLLCDFKMDGVADSISKCFLLGAIYGTGIAKIITEKVIDRSIGKNGEVKETPRVAVKLEAIRPDEFVIDPTARSVDEAEFCAHEMIKPTWLIRSKQKSGVYGGLPVGPYQGQKTDVYGTGRFNAIQDQDNGVLITEFYGQVPASMIPNAEGKGMVEAIVTIANESTVLRAVESPFLMKDRPIIAYQHDTVPGDFWGRGVCEKGYNPQKALDAELRARIDALALISAPMMGADVTRLPRNGDMRVRPGKTIFTRGRPSEVLEPIAFGNPAVLSHTFQHTGDLERMVQMGTGAMDSATPVGVNSRNETASGMSQMQSGMIKRSKRTMQNLERQFLNPLVKKAMWRYQQFAPERYPFDAKFKVNATLGIMAKEVENSQLINMLGFVPQESPAHGILVQAIFENSASANKKQLAEAIKAMTAPPSEEEQKRQQQMQELQMKLAIAEAQKAEAEAKKEEALAQKAMADTQLALARAEHERVKSDLEDDLVEIQAANAVTAAEKARVARAQTVVAQERNDIERNKPRP